MWEFNIKWDWNKADFWGWRIIVILAIILGCWYGENMGEKMFLSLAFGVLLPLIPCGIFIVISLSFFLLVCVLYGILYFFNIANDVEEYIDSHPNEYSGMSDTDFDELWEMIWFRFCYFGGVLIGLWGLVKIIFFD